MTLTAAGIIDQARGRHAAFDPTRHPNKVVLQYLSAYVRELHGKVAKRDPEALRSNVDQVLPLAVHENGIALADNRLVVEVVAQDARGYQYPVDLIPAQQRLDRGVRSASAWQIGNVLYLTSPATLWTRMVKVGIALVSVPVPLATLAATIPLPDTAELALVEKCAAYMARRHRQSKDEPLDVTLALAAAAEAEAEFLADITNRLTAQVFRTRDVYDP